MTLPLAAIGRVWPVALSVLLSMLGMGIPLPVLPVWVHDTLGFGPVIVGMAVGAQSVMTLLTRQYAGNICDGHGGRTALMLGCAGSAVSGLFYLASIPLAGMPVPSLLMLLIGRLVMGAAESMIITGGLVWGMARVTPDLAGQAMSWNGAAFFAALAIGAPVGVALDGFGGFGAVSVATVVVPLIGLAIVASLPGIPGMGGRRAPVWRVIGWVSIPGASLGLGGVGFGCVASFLVLDFAEKGWAGGGVALGIYGAAYVAPRILFGGVPDRAAGPGVALFVLGVETLGQLLIWVAPHPAVAMLGAAMTGAGLSLMFPLLGVPMVRRIPPANRGAAIGAYNAFMDVSLAVAGPIAGVVAGNFGLPFVFGLGTVCAAAAMPLAIATYRMKPLT